MIDYKFEYHTIPEIDVDDKTPKNLVKLSSSPLSGGIGWGTLTFMSDEMIRVATKSKLGISTRFEKIISNLSQDSIDHLKWQMNEDESTTNCYLPNHCALSAIVAETLYLQGVSQDEIVRQNTEINNQQAVILLLNKQIRTLQDTVNYQSQQNADLQLENKNLRKEVRKLQSVQSPDKNKGYVYLLRVQNHNDLFKIGRAKNPKNRLATFNVKLPFPVKFEHLIKSDNMYELEASLHGKFSDNRQNGSEFFLLSEKDVLYIKSL